MKPALMISIPSLIRKESNSIDSTIFQIKELPLELARLSHRWKRLLNCQIDSRAES